MLTQILLPAIVAASCVAANALAVGSSGKAKNTAHTLASNLMGYYNPSMNGVLPGPYPWWQAATIWDTAINYWHYSGDDQFNANIAVGLLAQAGANQDFMQPSATGNDDQLWWGLACMSAAEYGLPLPSDSTSSWLQLAKNVYKDVYSRWDPSSCNGGIGWQIDASNSSHTYKNSISNGLLFQLAARLGRYTSNKHYLDFATKVFDWSLSVGLIDQSTHSVYDGTDALKDCTDFDHNKWTYNVGVFLYGSAVMLSTATNDDSSKWQTHLDGFISAAKTDVTSNGIFRENCEDSGTCNTDQLSFKAYLSRWLVAMQRLVPETESKIAPLLKASVKGALASCNGSPEKDECGPQWTIGGFDGRPGVGQQMAALEVVHGQLAKGRPLPGKSRERRRVSGFVG